MDVLNVLTYEEAGEEAREAMEAMKKKMGKVPNIYAAMLHSPAAFKGLMAFKEGLGKGVITHKEAEAVAMVVGEQNQCGYCVAAHTALAKMNGFSAEEAKALRKAQSDDARLDALVKLAKEISQTRGRPGDEAVKTFYDAGYDDQALVEVIAHVCVNIFTNYFNHIADPDIDFPDPDR